MVYRKKYFFKKHTGYGDNDQFIINAGITLCMCFSVDRSTRYLALPISVSASIFPAKPIINDMCHHDGHHGRDQKIELILMEHLFQKEEGHTRTEQ
jgi:hypothetical protein